MYWKGDKESFDGTEYEKVFNFLLKYASFVEHKDIINTFRKSKVEYKEGKVINAYGFIKMKEKNEIE